MRGRGEIEVSSAAGIARRSALQIDDEIVRVKAVRGNAVTIVRWRWWHTLADRSRRWYRHASETGAVWWCRLRRHRLIGEYCRCGEREDPDWLDEWEFHGT